jgi:heat-inducible transcriptional repressor
MSAERRMEVLRAIVEDYVATREPVGSRAIAERRNLGVSPATVRNDMAALEEAGLIAQPHTSAGRIPTDRGYRVFVDRLSTVKPLSAAERRAIANFLDGAVDLDDVVDRAVHALASITHQVAMVQYPSLKRSELRHVELVRLAPNRVMAVVIMAGGRVEQRIVSIPEDLPDDALTRLRGRLNEVAGGKLLRDFADQLPGLLEEFPAEQRTPLAAITGELTRTLADVDEERVVTAGASNLASSHIDFAGSIRPVLEAIEEQVVMLHLLTEMAEDAGAVAVRIGHENLHSGLAEVSLVTAGYGQGGEPGQAVARLGVLGPTRMDYPSSIAAVRAVARYLSRILAT